MNHVPSSQALAKIWRDAGLDGEALTSLTLSGAEPALPSSFAVGIAAQTSIAAAALAAAEIWRMRGGRPQQVSVDMAAAAAEFRSERYLRVDGAPAPDPWDKIAGAYRCGDGRWVRLHTNFPHHRDGVLAILQCAYKREAVAAALRQWKAEDFEEAAARNGMVVAAMRSFAQWDAHPQGQAVAALPLLTMEKIGDAPPSPLPPASRPLGGIKVVELTRIIAGPVCGRTLAAHGADVMLVTAPHLPAIAPLVIDTGRGKLSTALDLRSAAGRAALTALIEDADIFIQGYRPGGLEALGFGPDAVARLRPGIVYVSLSAYGHAGPWAQRRGFDSLVQTASGFNDAEGKAAGKDEPRPLPAQALDHATGYLMAFAAMAALMRRAHEGGSWLVRASLAQTAQWLRSLGRIDGLGAHDPSFDDVQPFLEKMESPFGTLTATRHAATMSETPPHWARPPVPLGTHAPRWPVEL
jgi:crotonobetainyl-CoA:carnitine CoA-transferase CaiB-like acyl-CoA transferase